MAGRAPALALFALLALAGCGQPEPTVYTVRIADMAYGPVPSGLRVGDAIEWVNDDILQHTATARDGAFDVDLPPHARARTPLQRAGVVDLYCRYHPGMTARLVVSPAG